MSVSLKILPKIKKLSNKKDTCTLHLVHRDKSIQKPKKYLSLKNLYYNQEKMIKTKAIINKDLPILKFISISNARQYSMKTSLSDNAPNFLNYNICMINKYDEHLDSSLSFISKFDLEEDLKNVSNSFNSSNNEESCEEQIEIKSTSKRISLAVDEENDEKFDKEWNDIKEMLLNKEFHQ